MSEGKRRTSVASAIVAFALVGSLIVVGALAGAGAGAATSAPRVHEHDHESSEPNARQFHDAMRKLWEDHVTWTRLFIVSFAADLPDLGPTADRLLQNQVDIGDAIRPFYGDAAGDRLTKLLTEHITTAVDVLTAAKAGDSGAFDEALASWYRNGRQIARFLHEANPDNWPLRAMRRMMREHLDLTLAEASHRLAGDFEQDIADYEAVHVEILHMADMLSRGIIRQFPGMFA
ncbi:MAG: hypothetical protein ABWZ53_00280 [Actinomycetota bacterium]